MRKIIASALIALLVAAPGAAFAASATTNATAKPAAASAMAAPQTIASTVKAFDLKTHKLTLANGVSYVLPANFKDPGLKVGEKVSVKYQMNGKAFDVTSVTIG
tara:strand:+ start:1570 stop:1881 length:312 start_codon:yes stop_codon:yes gene_type:complete